MHAEGGRGGGVRGRGHLPRNVRLPAAPRLAQVLQDRARLVRLHALRHHIQDVVHHRRTQLEVVVRLDALLRHRLRDALRRATLELPREEVAQPALQQRHHAAQEEEPHPPARRPEAAARPLADGPGVEPVVDQVLQVLAHADLPHQPVFVAVHAGELADVGEDVLQPIGELVRVDVAQPVLSRAAARRRAVRGQVRDARGGAAAAPGRDEAAAEEEGAEEAGRREREGWGVGCVREPCLDAPARASRRRAW